MGLSDRMARRQEMDQRKQQEKEMRRSRQFETQGSMKMRTSAVRTSQNMSSPRQSQDSFPMQPSQQQQQQQYQKQQSLLHQQSFQHQQPPQHQQPHQQQHQQQQQPYQEQPKSSGWGKIKSVLTFGSKPSQQQQQQQASLGRNSANSQADPTAPSQTSGVQQPSGTGMQRPLSGVTGAPPAASESGNGSARDMQHRINVLESQLQEVEELRRQVVVEQRSTNDWRDKWNHQNFKVNLMVDMLVLRVLELDGTTGVGAGSGAPKASPMQLQAGGAGSAAAATATGSNASAVRPAVTLKRAPAYAQSEIIEDSIEDF